MKGRSSYYMSDKMFSPMQPLSLGILAALTPAHWEVELLDESFERFSYREADLVGLTAFTSFANRAYEIAAVYRAAGTPTVMGGIHASMLPDEALRFVDTVVIGEAESVWGKVIVDFEAGKLQKIYRGELLPLAGLPGPRRALFGRDYMLASVQTTRGCPMHCEFCSVPVFNGSEYRKRPVEEVLDELQSIPQKRLLFIDDNLIGKGKEDEERAISLFKGMIERKLNKKWGCQTSINVADNEEVLYYASKSGCIMMFIGIESEKGSALTDLGKKMNLVKLNRYNEIFSLVNKHKIAVTGGFIFGTDTDSVDDLINRVRFINKSRIDVVQPSILTPLPGTAIYKKYRDSGRLLYTDYPQDWDRYDMFEVLFEPALMSRGELKRIMISNWLSMGSWWNIFCKFLKSIIYTRKPLAALAALNSNRVYRGMLVKKIRAWKLNRKTKVPVKDKRGF